jgi:GMP synthase (glutamine-hydrolysing)
MRLLSLIHEGDVPSGSFSTTARELGHSVDEHSFSLGSPPSPADTYDAVMIFGGTDNVDERGVKPWMDRELAEVGRLIAGRTPVLGICLGGQLIAEAAGGSVFRMGHEGVGWQEVELTPEAPKDPVVGALPPRFRAYLWHEYQFSLPEKAVPLGRSDDCLQAFRLGDRVWALQFHPEVTAKIADSMARRLESIVGAHTVRWRGTSRPGTSWVMFFASGSSRLPPRPVRRTGACRELGDFAELLRLSQ